MEEVELDSEELLDQQGDVEAEDELEVEKIETLDDNANSENFINSSWSTSPCSSVSSSSFIM